jgi:hypothetical protein
MDFVQWCGVVLNKLLDLQQEPPNATVGVRFDQLESALSGEFISRPRSEAVSRAYYELKRLDIIEENHRYLTIPRRLHDVARDQRALWIDFSSQTFQPEEAQLLRALNRLSEHRHPDFAYVDMVPYEDLCPALGLEPGHDAALKVDRLIQNLRELDFATVRPWLNSSSLAARSTYRGLVWEHRGPMTVSSQQIDDLLQDGETHTVEFKRQLDLRTTSNKAEFIKDVIALANANATGPTRYILIGITNDGEYYDPQDPQQRANRDELLDALSAEKLQAIVSTHTQPVLQIRYAKVDYYAGPVGKLEILRDVTSIPYQVSKSIGSQDPKDKAARRLNKGQIFIRDGTITRRAEDEDIASMRALAERAKRRQQH